MRYLLVMCFGVILVSYAQRQEREIYTALAYGDGIFAPVLWYASAAEEETRTKATWTSFELDAVAYLDYLHFDEGIAPDELSDFFDKDWFTVTLSNYQDWAQQDACASGDILLFEFDVTFEDNPYHMRYWIEPVSPYRVAARFLVFPTTDPRAMQHYAARWFPDFVSCEQAG